VTYPFTNPVEVPLRRYLVTYRNRGHWLGGDAESSIQDFDTLKSVGILAAAFFDSEVNRSEEPRLALEGLARSLPPEFAGRITVEINKD